MMQMVRTLAILAVPLALAACLLMPGKFQSDLDLRKDGSFTFRYVGELVVLDTSSKSAEFTAQPCYDEANYEERPCTEEELAQQRADFDAMQADAKQDSSAPSGFGKLESDEDIAELVDKLRKEKGWRSVSYRGNRIIDVDYTITGKMSHGFAFPQVEGSAGTLAFVTITPRQDGSVKVLAQGFGTTASGDLGGLAALSGNSGSGAKQPEKDGTFTITTDGELLTNNTEDGPSRANGVSVLSWRITGSTQKAPEALIRLTAE